MLQFKIAFLDLVGRNKLFPQRFPSHNPAIFNDKNVDLKSLYLN